jgi:hypothetical protein
VVHITVRKLYINERLYVQSLCLLLTGVAGAHGLLEQEAPNRQPWPRGAAWTAGFGVPEPARTGAASDFGPNSTRLDVFVGGVGVVVSVAKVASMLYTYTNGMRSRIYYGIQV